MTAESPSTTDRLAEIRRHLEMAQAATANVPGTFWHTFTEDMEVLLKRRALLERAYEDAKEIRDKYGRRVIEWREAAENAKAENARLRARLDTAEGQLAQAVKVVADRDAEWKANSEDWARHPSTNIHDDRLRDQEQAIANEIADLHTEFVRALGPDGEGSR